MTNVAHRVRLVLGLLPLVLEIGGSSSFLTPMAIAIVWGLGFATALTLLMVPAFYMIIEDLLRVLGADPLRHSKQRI